MQKKLSMLITVAAFLLVGSCTKDVGVLLFDRPPREAGTRQLIITTERFNGQPISGYSLVIQGPVSITTSPSGQVYVLNDVTSGQYTFIVTKPGYIGTTKVLDVTVPADPAIEYRHHLSVQLTEKVPATLINNAAGGMIVVPPTNTGGSGIGSNPIMVTIPPGAIPGAGNTAISITPVPLEPGIAPPVAPNGGAGGFTLVCEPEGLIFTQPIQVAIPMDIPVNLVGSINFNLVYKTGNISTGNLNFSNDIIPLLVSPDGKTGVAKIPHFSAWQEVGDYVVEIVVTTTPWALIGHSEKCGDGVDGVLTLTGLYNAPYSNFLNIPQSDLAVIFNEAFSYPPVEGFFRIIFGRYRNCAFTLRNLKTQQVLGKFTIPCYPVELLPSPLQYCHDSGGG